MLRNWRRKIIFATREVYIPACEAPEMSQVNSLGGKMDVYISQKQ